MQGPGGGKVWLSLRPSVMQDGEADKKLQRHMNRLTRLQPGTPVQGCAPPSHLAPCILACKNVTNLFYPACLYSSSNMSRGEMCSQGPVPVLEKHK